MSTYLLANVGTRDVQLDTLDDLPPELIANPKTGQLKARPAGAYLLQPEQFTRLLPRLRLPMITKALTLLAPRSWADLRIVLFASDQDATVREQYRDGDTIHFAQIIREVLFARHQGTGLTKKQIEVRRSNANPADYDRMYDFYQQELPTIARRDPAPNPAYLLIAGGTPQMNTMLLLLGIETFGPSTIPLYVTQEGDRARKLDTVRLLYRQSLQRNLDVMLGAYAYGPAQQLLERNADYLERDEAAVLKATLDYALARRNLDLTAAAAAFDDAFRSARNQRELIASFQQEIADSSEQTLLRETIYLAQLAAATANWSDFLARLHRFAEGCMQLLAERLGVQWGDAKKRSSYAAPWWNAQRPLLVTLGLADAVPPADPAAENRQREVDRRNLRAIIAGLATDPAHAPICQALAALEQIDKPIPLRNAIVHRFTPLSATEIEHKAGAALPDLLAAMRLAYSYAFGQVVAEQSPYDTLNQLCADILKGQL